eukprot:2339475-Rhodomonas_salina.1
MMQLSPVSLDGSIPVSSGESSWPGQQLSRVKSEFRFFNKISARPLRSAAAMHTQPGLGPYTVTSSESVTDSDTLISTDSEAGNLDLDLDRSRAAVSHSESLRPSGTVALAVALAACQ